MRYRLDECTAHVAEWLSFQGQRLTQRYSDARRFLQALDPSAGSFSFRSFSDTPYTRKKGGDPLERAIHGSLESCWSELVELNHRGAAICVTINRTNGHSSASCTHGIYASMHGSQGRTEADIREVRALFVDDDRPPASMTGRFALTPQIQVLTSPGHYHHYWLVRDLPVSRFRDFQLQLAQRYGTDRRVAALNQAMQLPGFWRRKSLKQSSLPTIHRLSPCQPYSLETVQRLLPLKIGSHYKKQGQSKGCDWKKNAEDSCENL